jgi:hypothetical protein
MVKIIGNMIIREARSNEFVGGLGVMPMVLEQV